MKEVKKDESKPPAENPTSQVFTSLVRRIHELPRQDEDPNQPDKTQAENPTTAETKSE